MPRALFRPPLLRGRVFLARDAVNEGLLTRQQLRTSAWRRLFQGVYADSSLEITHQTRCSAAAQFVLPKTGVIAGRSAATLHGVGLAAPDDPVEALAPRGTEVIPYQGLIVHRALFSAEETMEVDGCPVTTPVRTCWDLALWLDPVEAVVLIDRMLGRRLVTIAQLRTYLGIRHDERPRPRGWRRFARVLPLLDGRAESPPESRLRVRLVLAGLPKPTAQYTIRTVRSGFIARVDLAWEDFRLAMEYDGLWHAESPKQIHKDRERLNALQLAGWTVLHVTAQRLRSDFVGIVAEVRRALRRGRPT